MHAVGLQDLLQNELILRHIGPYLGVAVLSLAATSRTFRLLVANTPEVLTYLDLSRLRSLDANVTWNRKPQSDDDSNPEVTEEDLYSQPLNRVFVSLGPHFMTQVRIMILDGLYMSSKILLDLLCHEDYSIRVLSLRGVHGLSDSTMLRVLRYAFRPSRLLGGPALKALYCCTPTKKIGTLERAFRDMTVIGEYEHFSSNSVMARSGASLGAGVQEASISRLQFDPFVFSPYHDFGFNEEISNAFSSGDWASFMSSCQSSLSFDAVLCPMDHHPTVATVRLQGCQSCGSCPEKPAYPGRSVCVTLFSSGTSSSLISFHVIVSFLCVKFE